VDQVLQKIVMNKFSFQRQQPRSLSRQRGKSASPPGYGMEAMLTNDLCKRIISDEIASRFQRGDFGLTAAINAMIAKSPR
jgi:hypothetical protein